MRIFVRVAERGNLSAVARELNMGQSSITRHLRDLEDALGVMLLSRTTRRVRLTDEGSRYYAKALQILHLVEQAGDEATNARSTSTGLVRLSCTAALGVRHISRLIFRFQDLYPEISVDLNLTDECVDLVREGIDVALRLAPLADSSMKLRAIGQSHRVLVASPDYLTKYGRPETPEELLKLEGIRMVNVAGSETIMLKGQDGAYCILPFDGRFRVNHGLAAREAILAGRGYGPAHIWLVDDLLARGRLETILPGHSPPPVPLNMLIAPDRTNIARIRRLIEFLAEEILQIPGISRF